MNFKTIHTNIDRIFEREFKLDELSAKTQTLKLKVKNN